MNRLPISQAFFWFLLISILTLGISLGGVAVFKIDELLKDSRDSLIRQQMDNTGRDISHYLNLRRMVLQDYAEFPVMVQGVMQPSSGLANVSDFIDDLLLLGERVPVHLLDLNGDLIYSRNPGSQCLQQKNIITTLLRNDKSKGGNIGFCNSGKNNSQKHWLLLAHVKYHEETEGFLIAELPDSQLIRDLDLGRYAHEYQIVLLKQGKTLMDLGPRYTGAVSTIDIPGIGVTLAYRSDPLVLKEARTAVALNFSVFLILVLIVIVIISRRLGADYLVRPLENLKELAETLGRGEHISSDVSESRIQEIQALADQFRRMAENIERREDDLKETNRELSSVNNQMMQQQQMLVHSEKLASVGQLAAGVAHEINNPTGYVRSNLEMLNRYTESLREILLAYRKAEDTLRPADADSADILKKLREEHDLDYILTDMPDLMHESLEGITRIQNIVMDLKSFSRVDEQEMQTVDLNESVVEAALRLVYNEIKYKCDVVRNLNELPPVTCKPGEISQVIMNLLTNACDAINTKGSISVSTYCKGDNVYIEVSDTGEGISEEGQLRLFDPFYTTKEIGKGTGLGLSICQAIIQKHGGEITVRSRLGHGTTFTVWVPVGKQVTEEVKEYE